MITRWALKIGIAVLLVSGSASPLLSQTSDFFSNTQSSGKLASGSDCPINANCAANSPGFNPVDVVKHADPGATFSGWQGGGPTAVAVFFSQVGPGAITDNMFGIISTVLADATICGDLPPPAPADQNTGLGVPPGSVGSNSSSLNCGDLRFDPTSQSQTIPTFPASNNITSGSDEVTFINDFNASSDDHIGFRLTNKLDFTATQTMNTQQMRQVTALTAGGTAATVGSPGTELSPGTGDQALDIITSWPLTTQSSTPTPVITWTMTLDDLDPLTPAGIITNQTDSINTMGLLATDSSFTYNTGTFPSTLIPAPCWWDSCTAPTETIAIP